MKSYLVLRRGGWRSAAELEKATARASEVGEQAMANDVRWIRSYVLAERGGQLGTACIYRASSPEKIREHAARAGLPLTEMIGVTETVVAQPDFTLRLPEAG